ncbi:YciK family oxidoreductase [Allohahella sp. A8]|uniref:YciK family oxidoreductase n=1 Tax=Allohahella sp. A8 TaxID=3141461 RepID=UPI003A7FFD1F
MFSYQAPSDLLKERVILVTGAGSGIGRTAALTYARHGASVILVGRTISKLESVYDEIEAAGGAKPAIFPVNLESALTNDYDQLAVAIEDTFGRLDGLLHNAGVLGQLTPLEQYDPDSFNRVMQVNVHAEFLMTRALIPLLKQSQDGSLVFTSSSVGRKGRAYWGAYSISKFAVEGMMQVLAEELGSAVRVNSLNPGGTRTAMRANAFPGEDPESLPTPEDIMPVYLYLMGADSRGISGQTFSAREGAPGKH